MHAEILAIGTELTTGAKLDTNSQWLSIELAALGIPVRFHTTIADELSAMASVLRDAIQRSDIVLITGGLGPTLDDLTRQAMAEVAGVPLILDVPSLDHIKSMFARRKRVMAERNVIQAMFPEGSEPVPNPRGTAPGIWMTAQRKSGGVCLVAAMPGVPSEMKPMFFESIRPRLPGGDLVIRRFRVNCFGIGESDCEQMLGEMTARGRDPEVGITVHEATITLRIEAQGKTSAECDAKIAQTTAEIRQTLGSLVFGVEDEELEHVLVRMLLQRGKTLATVESGTGGLLAQRLTSVAGFAPAYFGGLVLPTDQAKQRILDLSAETLSESPVVSAEVAREMAVACRGRFGTDYALAVTAAPPYDPAATSGGVPSLYVALSGEGLLEHLEQVLLGDVSLTRSRAAKSAMNLLRLRLMRDAGEPTSPPRL
ncbi:MAG: CinA family nicotinamide mononucleotide deamidase-related protein [Planctomycetaceae bacterium]|nr:CinA family nicotinamide mononucleotide deamidase-related protein [Planctomycetaceae bacterium]